MIIGYSHLFKIVVIHLLLLYLFHLVDHQSVERLYPQLFCYLSQINSRHCYFLVVFKDMKFHCDVHVYYLNFQRPISYQP